MREWQRRDARDSTIESFSTACCKLSGRPNLVVVSLSRRRGGATTERPSVDLSPIRLADTVQCRETDSKRKLCTVS